MRRSRQPGSLAAALLVVGSAFPAKAFAAEAARRLELRSVSQCPDAETLRDLVGPLLPGWTVDVATDSGPGDGEHLASWDERGLRFDGGLVKKRGGETDCRRLAENWAVTLALLAETPEARVVLEDVPDAGGEKESSDAPASEEAASEEAIERPPAIERRGLVSGAGGLFVPLVADGSVRGLGELDAQAVWGRWGLRLALGATSVERVRAEGGPEGLVVGAAQAWATVGVAVEVPLPFGTLSGTLGPLLALDHVEGSGVERAFRSLSPNVGVDVGVVARFPLGDSWVWLASFEGASFPRPAALSVRNATTGEEVSLGSLPAILPRFGVGFGRSFGW